MPNEAYSQRGNPQFEAEMAARTASREAAFLLPHLRRGMRLLDVGCGPGSITVGLAAAVAPGETFGIDIQPGQIEQARARANDAASFRVGDCYALPFPDARFDAAFANGVLMHVREPLRALAELRRVLRPGGVVALRDPDVGTSIYTPSTPRLERWLALRVQVRLRNGGDPFASRRYRQMLLEAGFVRAIGSASVNCAGSLQETRRHAAFLRAQLAGFAATVLEQRWMDPAEIDATAAEIDAWAERPDAFTSTTWCQALGWVPGAATS